MQRIIPKIAVCPSHALAEGQCRKLKMLFEGREDECLLLRFEGKVYAYINRCVHMPRRLDCEQKKFLTIAAVTCAAPCTALSTRRKPALRSAPCAKASNCGRLMFTRKTGRSGLSTSG